VTVADAFVAAVLDSLPDDAYVWDGSEPMQNDDLVVFDSRVPPEPPHRYVVVYPDNGTLNALAVCKVSDSATFRVQTFCVAPDRVRAAWLSQRVRDGVTDLRLSVDGWSCGQILHTYGQLPQRDEQPTERPNVHMIDQFQLLASRVPAAE
jgi:hypothetical protein